MLAQIRRFFDFISTRNLDRRYPFSTNEGYGAFTSLAGFAVAQSVALTAVAKDENYLLVIGIYLISVLVTMAWIWSMLQRTREQPPGATKERAYDEPSITYGRWTLGWTFFVAALMVVLGAKGLLPNQTPRIPFDRTGLESCKVNFVGGVTPRDYLQDFGGSPSEREPLGVWIKWLQERESLNSARQQDNAAHGAVVLIMQKQDFKKRYMPFAVRLKCNNQKYRIGDRLCFLLKPDMSSIRPNFRQLAFRQASALGPILDIADIPYADPGEALLVIAEVFRMPVKDEKNKIVLDKNQKPVLYDFPSNEEQLGIELEWTR